MIDCVCTPIDGSVMSCKAKHDRDASSPWTCTREYGHTGDHVACGGSRAHEMFSWPDATVRAEQETSNAD